MNLQELNKLARIFLIFVGAPAVVLSLILFNRQIGSVHFTPKIIIIFIASLIGVFVIIVIFVKMVRAIIESTGSVRPSSTTTSKSLSPFQVLKRDFREVIKYIKDEKLAVQGKPRLYRRLLAYRLPFFIIIGAEKDALLQAQGKIYSCFYIADDKAVLIDPKDHLEDLIKLLKRRREFEPLNGVIVATDIQSADNADGIRNQINKLITGLNYNFPVYFMFMNINQLGGFNEFFKESPNELWRAKVTGKGSSEEAFEQECNKIYNWLLANELRILLLNQEAQIITKQNIALFPDKFKEYYTQLVPFVKDVFQKNRRGASEGLLFRGFFLTITDKLGELLAVDRYISRWTKKEKKIRFWMRITYLIIIIMLIIEIVIFLKLKG